MKTAAQTRPARRGWPWIAAMLVAALLLGAGLYLKLRPGTPELVGAVATSEMAAPDFKLTDQFGQPQQLSSFRGRPVALTFIYTNCPDICPLIATNMHGAYQKLGDDAGKVALLAVTVDPERDTVAQIRGFSDSRLLTNEWHFLTGTRPELEQVWSNYGIYAQPVDAEGTPVANPSVDERADAVEHTAPVYLLDKQGNVRVLLPVDFSASDLATDLKVLLAER